jgi:tetratricopeptide (TPR) repeat protein
VFVADDFAAWCVEQLADAGRRRLVTLIRGTDQEKALREAARVAVQRTAEQLRPGIEGSAEELAMVIGQVFGEPVHREAHSRQDATLLEEIRAGVWAQLAPLDDPGLTGTGQSAAQVLGIPAAEVAEQLASRLLQEIIVRGSGGGPLTPLADQLNHDVTHLRQQRIEGLLATVLDAVTTVRGAVTATSDSAPVTAVAHTLPPDVASFTGREAELGRLMAAADQPGAPGVITISAIGGMAGVGKTSFAVHAAHLLAARFPDGQLFVPLHGHTPGQQPTDPFTALAGLLLATGSPAPLIPPGLAEREAMWRDRMADRRVLLLLDDATGSSQVRPLLPAAAGTLVLITSRHRLTALPDATPAPLEVLEPGEAGRLFSRLAGRQEIQAGDRTVAIITERCGRLPLAISLAAGQLKHHATWSAADLAEQLEPLSGRLTTLAAESESVAASFNLSYANLAHDERQLFRRLGLHPGTDIDAYAAASLNGTGLTATRRLLDRMFSYHLIMESVPGRYRFHDLIAEYARMLAADDPPDERNAALIRLLDYYLHTARIAERRQATPARTARDPGVGNPPEFSPELPTRDLALAWLETERLNLQATATEAAARGQPRHAIAIITAMRNFLRNQGLWEQEMALHRIALDTARKIGDPLAEADALSNLGVVQQLADEYSAALESHSQALELYRNLGDQLGEADALDNLGSVHRLSDEYSAAIASHSQALELYRNLGDQLGEADALDNLGSVHRLSDEYSAAIASHSKALELYRNLGSQLGEADALSNLASVHQLTGDYQVAAASYARALELYRSLDNRLGEGNTLNYLASVEWLTGDYPAATASASLALDVHRHLGNRLGEAAALSSLASVAQLNGDYPAAAANASRALDVYRHLGNRLGEAETLNSLASTQALTGDYPAAAANASRALEVYRHLGNRLGEAETLIYQGNVCWLTSDYPAAAAGYSQALDLYRSLGSQLGEAESLNDLGGLHQLTGDYPAAAASLSQALDLYRSLGDPLGEANALNNSGNVAQLTGDYPAAAATYSRALDLYRSLGDRLGEANALNNLGNVHRVTTDYAAAAASLSQALDLYRGLGSRLGEAEALNNMGELALASRGSTDALGHHEQALAIAADIGSVLERARAMEGIGYCQSHNGWSDRATTTLHQAQSIYDQIGSPRAAIVRAFLREHHS